MLEGKTKRNRNSLFGYLSKFMKTLLGTKRDENDDKTDNSHNPCWCMLHRIGLLFHNLKREKCYRSVYVEKHGKYVQTIVEYISPQKVIHRRNVCGVAKNNHV